MPYFDAASALPLHPVAREALTAALDEGWADPARLHREGRRARMLLDAARETAAEAVGCRPDELVFTPSGTDAVHRGIAGALSGRRRVGRRLLVSAVEHSAVLHAAQGHAATAAAHVGGPGRDFGDEPGEEDDRNGGNEKHGEGPDGGQAVAYLPVDRAGLVSPADCAAALTADTALVCVQSANHEVGTVQPVADIAGVCTEAGVPLLVDAAQSLPWGPVGGRWSLLAGSAHKWGGPPGVGLLAVRKGTRFAAPGPRGERESGRVPGFENVPAVVAAAASLRAVRAGAEAEAVRLRALVDRLRARIPEVLPDVEVVGDPVRRLPHLLTFSCLYADGEAVLHALDEAGFAVSSGSSCTSDTLTPSHVLRAMGVLSEGNVRVSLPPGTAEADVERFLAVLPDAVARVRAHLDAPAAERGPSAAARAGARTGAEAEAEDPAGSTGSPGSPDRTLDALGTLCPVPVIRLAKVIEEVPAGGVVTVLADDEAARLDIPAWCEMRGHDFLGSEGTAHRVRRRG